ncbi:MAG: SPW repeat domain-containing protein [Dehalococcoidia bacterium]
MWTQIAGAGLGIWLMAAPAVLGYGGFAADNGHVIGPLAASFATVAIWQVTRPVRWANLPLGAWLILAPWLFNYERDALINSLVVGLLLMLLASMRSNVDPKRLGGGWSVLWARGDRAYEPARMGWDHGTQSR